MQNVTSILHSGKAGYCTIKVCGVIISQLNNLESRTI